MEKALSVWVIVLRRDLEVRGKREGLTVIEHPSGLGGNRMVREVGRGEGGLVEVVEAKVEEEEEGV